MLAYVKSDAEKRLREFLRRMERGGLLYFEHSGNGHYAIRRRDNGSYVCSCSHSPRDVNAVHQLRRDLRRHGYNVA